MNCYIQWVKYIIKKEYETYLQIYFRNLKNAKITKANQKLRLKEEVHLTNMNCLIIAIYSAYSKFSRYIFNFKISKFINYNIYEFDVSYVNQLFSARDFSGTRRHLIMEGTHTWHLDWTFHNKLIERGNPTDWPSRSPDLAPLHFSLFGLACRALYKYSVNYEIDLVEF